MFCSETFQKLTQQTSNKQTSHLNVRSCWKFDESWHKMWDPVTSGGHWNPGVSGEKSPTKISVWSTPGGLGALHKFFRTSTRQSAPCSHAMPMPCLSKYAMPHLKSTKNEHESDFYIFLWTINEEHSYDQLGQHSEIFKRQLWFWYQLLIWWSPMELRKENSEPP